MKTRTSMVLLAAGLTGLLMSGCATTYRVRAQAADGASRAMAAQLEDDVCGALVARGYTVLKGGEGGRRTTDIRLDVTRKEVARLDDWRLYEGKARAEVVSGKGGLMGKKSFKAKGERSLDEGEAEAGAVEGLAQQINEWLPTVLPPAKR